MIHPICKIDIALYSVVTSDIQTDEVIITDERIEHIRTHHGDDFEIYREYFSEILRAPDYRKH